MTRQELNEKARRDAAAFREEFAKLGVETEVAAHDTDEDYFDHLVSEAVCYAYSSHLQVQALADLKALLLLGVDAIILRRVEAAFTPETTGERAYSEYFSNVMIPRLRSLGDDCPPDVRAKVVQELKAAAPLQYTFGELLRDTYRAHPGLHLPAGGPEVMARREFFLRRVAGVLDPSRSKPGGKRGRNTGGKRGARSPRPAGG
jgi:hypothetical protein